jgi:hypothetical protein
VGDGLAGDRIEIRHYFHLSTSHLSLLETLFVRVWRCRSSFANQRRGPDVSDGPTGIDVSLCSPQVKGEHRWRVPS